MRPLVHEFDADVRRGSATRSFRIVLIALHGELHASIAVWRAVRDKQVDALRRESEERALTLEQSIELLQESDDEDAGFRTDDEDL